MHHFQYTTVYNLLCTHPIKRIVSPRSAYSPIDEPSRSIASPDGIESDLTNEDPFGGDDSVPTLTIPLLVEAVLAETSGREMMGMSDYAWPKVELGYTRGQIQTFTKKCSFVRCLS